MSEYKCLTIKQPWAGLIAYGFKTIETRSWQTNYRGRIYIHAGKTIDEAMYDEFRRGATFLGSFLGDDPASAVAIADSFGADEREFEQRFRAGSQIVAVANLIDCRPFEPSDRNAAMCDAPEGYFAWVLEDVRRFVKPIPVKGALGIWDVSKRVFVAAESLETVPAV